MSLNEVNEVCERIKANEKKFFFQKFVMSALASFAEQRLFLAHVSLACTLFFKNKKRAASTPRKLTDAVGIHQCSGMKFNYARDLFYGESGALNPPLAVQLLKELQEEDLNPELRICVLYQLAQCLNEGNGIERDSDCALKLWEEAESLGCQESAFALGLYWDNKINCSLRADQPDRQKAILHYSKGKRSHLKCSTNLGILLLAAKARPHRQEGLDLLKWSSARGDLLAVDALSAFGLIALENEVKQ